MDKDPENGRRGGWPRLGSSRLAWWPIPAFLVALIVLRALGLRGPHESTFLVIALNVVFSLSVSLLIAYLMARSFLVRGAPGLLLLGCGVIFWSLAGVVATTVSRDPNVIITIHNNCVWLSAVCHLAGVSVSLRARRSISPTALWLPVGYVLAAGAVAVVTLAALAGWLPTFFVQGRGGTPVRQFVLISASAMFALTALLLRTTGRRPLSSFVYWYALALGLLAVGLLGVWLQSSAGSILGWTGRVAQFLGGVYMLIAAVASVRESHAWRIPLEAALRGSTDRLHLALDAAHMGTWDWDLTSDEIVWNEEHYRILGYEPGGVKPSYQAWAERIHPDDLAAVQAVLRRSMEQGTDYTAEYRTRWADGTVHWGEARGQFEADAAGKAVRSYGVLLDITERKRAEETLRESEERFRRLAENNPFIIGRYDRQHRYLYLKPAAQRVTGRPAAEFLGKTPREAGLPPELCDRWEESQERVFAGERVTMRFTLTDPAGRQRHLWDLFVPEFAADGSVQTVLAICQDVTELVEAQDQLQRLNATLESKVAQRTAELAYRAKQLQKLTLQLTQAEEQERRRIALLLHEDLQQQIAGAKFHLSLVRHRTGDDRQRTEIDTVDAMLRDAIEQSRHLSHDLSPAVLHMNDLAEVLLWLANRMRMQHGLTVKLEVAGDVLLQSEALATFLFRAAQEMLFNVVKHAQVRTAGMAVRRVGRYVCLGVSDQGRGFDPQALQETPGVGLFSIRERVGLLGGRMTVKSTPGQGSRFTILVPDGGEAAGSRTAVVGEEQTRTRADNRLPAPDHRPPLRVLLVDDHNAFRASLAALLGGASGIEVIGATAEGREGIKMALDLHPDVVVMDASMPNLSGDQVTQQIKTQLPQTRVIGLSMYDAADKKEKMLQAGAECYLLKTVSANELLAALRGPEPDPPTEPV